MSSHKKRKEQQRKRKQKERKRRAQPPSPGMVDGLPPNALVVQSPPGVGKMSEVLLEFLEPYTEFLADPANFEKLVGVAVIAWNAALLSGSEREGLIQDALGAFPSDARADARGVIDELMRRKEAHFASNRRMIVNFEVTWTPRGPHLSVMSTFGDE